MGFHFCCNTLCSWCPRSTPFPLPHSLPLLSRSPFCLCAVSLNILLEYAFEDLSFFIGTCLQNKMPTFTVKRFYKYIMQLNSFYILSLVFTPSSYLPSLLPKNSWSHSKVLFSSCFPLILLFKSLLFPPYSFLHLLFPHSFEKALSPSYLFVFYLASFSCLSFCIEFLI